MHWIQALAHDIDHQTKAEIRFNNGCWLSLNEDSGMLCGTTPYGVDVFFDSSSLNHTIAAWVAFWNEPRDELGRLCEPANHCN